MTKRERVLAAAARRPVDRPPVSLWRHAPDRDHDPALLAEATLAFHERWDLDLIKVTPSGVYCVEDWGCRVAYTGSPDGAKQCIEHAVQTVTDWKRIRPLDPGAGALGRELEALRRIARARPDDAPVLHTVFSPLTVARKLRGERLDADLRAHPEAVELPLEMITETIGRYALAALEAGADGLFFATQTAARTVTSDDAYARWEAPLSRRVLERVRGAAALVVLHAHGQAIRFDDLASLPVDAINWHDRLAPPTLGEAFRRTTRGLVGGLGQLTTLRTGPPEAVTAEARAAVAQTTGLGLILAPGCVLPLDVPDEHLAAAVKSVRRSIA